MMYEQRKQMKVGVLYGGDSAERPGSIISSKTIETALKQAGYSSIYRIDVTRKTAHTLSTRNLDVAFLSFHGGFGENGELQGFLDILGIPYTSSGIAASAISSDKHLFNRFVRALGYNSPEQHTAESIEELRACPEIFPAVIKPAKQGCSYGLFFVRNIKELLGKGEFSLKFGKKVVVDKHIPGREFSVGVYLDPETWKPYVLPVAETILEKEVFDFEAKYPGGEHLSSTEIPAKIQESEKRALEEACSDIFTTLRCRGYVLMDVRLADDGRFYFLENNTIPGMLSAEESYIPRMLAAEGKKLPEFVDAIVMSALKAHDLKQAKVPSEEEMVNYLGIKLAED